MDCFDAVNPSGHSRSSVDSAAAAWLAKRDRGLVAAEQDAYLQWLRENPAHSAAIAQLERMWSRLDGLHTWQPAHSSRPNPDLLAPPRRRLRWIWPTALAAAAAVTIAAFVCWQPLRTTPRTPAPVAHTAPEKKTLEDGTVVDLNTGAEIEVKFTATTRAVRLVRGEAHFAVAKNPARPFVVTADTFEVRAVGTAFAVQLNPGAVSVLVTEGRVKLDELPAAADDHAPRIASELVAGQEALVVLREGSSPNVHVREVAADEIARLLAWQSLQLEFVSLPLREVVEAFNRHNTRRLLIEDHETGEIVVGGSFRADNIEPFVRLLDLGFGVSAYPRGDDIVLRRRR
jgi:transmembrane sensor